jgi:predicted DNA-binding WGR domain protein
MIKFYKKIDEKFYYWEIGEKDEKIAIVHFGVVGDKGRNEEIKSTPAINIKTAIQKLVDQKIVEGYKEFDEDDCSTLLVEFTVNGLGTIEDLKKRHRLEDKLNEVLGETGLGYCDGGSIGSGTMDVCCYVIDFDLAKKIIETNLEGTEFSNYTEIFEENTNR